MSEALAAETAGLGHSQPAPEAVIANAEPDHEPKAEGQYDPATLLQEVASEMGWAPKEKWRGNPEEWRDIPDFFRNTPKVLKSLRDQVRRSGQATAEIIERNRRQAIEDAERRIAEAAEAGDREAATQAAEDLKRANDKPDPLVADFYAKHNWMTPGNPAYSVALAAAQKVADTGGSVQAQLDAAEKEVRKRFPEEFGEEGADAPARKQPPAVEGGQRTASGAPRKKGWSDLPATVRQSVSSKQLKDWGLSQDEYAAAYWKENG